ncbi:MAG: DNA repair protein RecO [Planctomycetota bacterium]|nr:DNA repair protein RecO [Planctomycetota bacterium]
MKGVFRTRALVLRCTDFSETSQVIRVFTRDQGILDMLAKGSRRPARASSAFPSPFDLAGWYDLNYRARGTDLHLATEAQLVEGFDHLRRDLPSWLDATFVLDVLRNFFSPGDPHPDLLREVLQYLKLLEHGQGRRRLRNRFLQSALHASGVLPRWDCCSECEREIDTGAYLGIPSGLICSFCAGSTEGQFIDPRVRAYLAADSGREWGLVPSWEVPPREVDAAWNLLKSLLLHHLERPPRSLRYLRV